MRKADKPIIVEDLEKKIKGAKSVTVLNYQGMPNKALIELRQKVTAAGGTFLVAKNTLLKRALDSSNFKSPSIDEGLNGPTAIVFADGDEIAPLQVLGKSVTETELPKLKFGIFAGDILAFDKLLALSKLPGKNVLEAKLLGALIAPKYNMVGVLNANLQKLVFILDQRAKAVS